MGCTSPTDTSRVRRDTFRRLPALASCMLALGCAAAWPQLSHAGETKAFVVSWFHLAANSTDDDCPQGLNPKGHEIMARILAEQGKSPADIVEIMKGYPGNYPLYAVKRGSIDGKPVNVYQNPTSVPDPQIKVGRGRKGFGFNLDGRIGPDDFVDPQTGEQGVDNQLFRAFGCFSGLRGTPTSRPTWLSIQWDMSRDQMPAWLIEISDVDSLVNDDSVELEIYRAREPIFRNVLGEPQSFMTFQVDPDTRMHHRVKARIKDGVLSTDVFDFYMIADFFLQPEFIFKNARLRLDVKQDGTLKGIIGGYSPWDQAYLGLAAGESAVEGMVALDMPGIYYALRRLADGEVDPQTGTRTTISSAFTVEAIPAFIVDAKSDGNGLTVNAVRQEPAR